MKGQYEDARVEIDNRIVKLEELISEIENALGGNPGLNQSTPPKVASNNRK